MTTTVHIFLQQFGGGMISHSHAFYNSREVIDQVDNYKELKWLRQVYLKYILTAIKIKTDIVRYTRKINISSYLPGFPIYFTQFKIGDWV